MTENDPLKKRTSNWQEVGQGLKSGRIVRPKRYRRVRKEMHKWNWEVYSVCFHNVQSQRKIWYR